MDEKLGTVLDGLCERKVVPMSKGRKVRLLLKLDLVHRVPKGEALHGSQFFSTKSKSPFQ
jgi:hypothetical protein